MNPLNKLTFLPFVFSHIILIVLLSCMNQPQALSLSNIFCYQSLEMQTIFMETDKPRETNPHSLDVVVKATKRRRESDRE